MPIDPKNADNARQSAGAEAHDEGTGVRVSQALIERFHVLDEVPSDGQARLFRIREDPNLVLKVYPRGVAVDLGIRDRLRGVESRHVAKVFDVGVFDGHPFELIEYIPGGNLAELYGHSNSEEITEVVHQIADALHGLHSVRLVHGDLKPQNVLIRNRAPLDLALIDFGNETGTTVPYAAPERLAGQIGGPAVDWWGLGVIVHELAAGTEAGRESDAVAAVRILTEPVDLGDVADLRIRLLCEGLLARDPVLRWNHVRVREWLEGPPVADPLLPSRASRNPERRRQLRGRTVVPPAEQTDPRRVRPVVQGDAALVFESEVAAREFASNDSESPSWVNSGLDLRAK